MNIIRWAAAFTAAGSILLAGCASAPTHPELLRAEQAGQLPPLVPVRRFVANIDFAAGYVLSPDGRQLLWNQTVGLDAGLAVRPVEGGATTTFATGYLARPDGLTYGWLPDSRHLVYVKDLSGSENTQLHVLDSRSGFDPWAVTPWPGTRSRYVGPGPRGSSRFFFASNRRDRSTLDLYEADALSRTVREVARSDGRVLGWIVDGEGRLAGRMRQLGERDGSDVALEVREGEGGWRQVRSAKGMAFENFWVARIDLDGQKAWAISSIGRDKAALVEVDLKMGGETVLAEHPVVDVRFGMYPPRRGAPWGYVVDAGRPAARFFDPALDSAIADATARARSQGLLDGDTVTAQPQSVADDGQRMVLRVVGDYDIAELLWDRRSGALSRLDPRGDEAARLLSPEQPFSFQASDGRTIHGYYVRPRGVTGPAPLVMQIHGGPWVRDYWRSATFNTDQLLANRGYAVMTVNYRGSGGYGRSHMKAGFLQTFGAVQKDIAEAADWAIAQGIADRERMAVLGGSFGGFSVLAQLIHQHHDWRCGINVVGAANWPRLIENWPPFWRNRHYFEAFFGDVTQPAERERMLANSPVSHLHRIKAPLLVIHGANDVRVLRQDSDDVVAELRKLGRPVEYLSFPNEGHQVRRWRNRLEMWRRIEDTLAGCLGGRSAGWDFYQLMPR